MFEAHFGLTRRPFLTTADPDFLFWSKEHDLAYTILRYGLITRATITVITGEIGAGKTMLLRQLMREIPDDTIVGLISNMQAGRGELLQWVMMSLGEHFGDASYVELFAHFQKLVVDAYAAGKRVVLIFDEAQNMSMDSLEELRMLSNINADGDDLLQLVLVGQPQLRDMLARPEMTQFIQRVTADFHLGPLSQEETKQYIHHRMELAGAQWSVFVGGSIQLIHDATGGVPRKINTLCDLCLVYGYAAEEKVIDQHLVREFLTEARQRNIYQQFGPIADKTWLVSNAR